MRFRNNSAGNIWMACSLVLMLSGCGTSSGLEEPDFPAAPEEPASYIEIVGGKPSGLSAASRANEPSVYGVCEADLLDIFTFSQSLASGLAPVPKYEGLSYSKVSAEIALTKTTGSYNANKWTSYSVPFTVETFSKTGFAFPAIAYSQKDAGLFSVTPSSSDLLSDLKVDLSADGTGLVATPELYFGRLNTTQSSVSATLHDLGDYFFYLRNDTGHTVDYSFPLQGKLYRIVSQVNVDISDVPEAMVAKMEMYVSRLPRQITLYGSHGAFYPVAAATESQMYAPGNDEKGVLVSTTSDFKDGKAHLSTFMLPFETGYQMYVKVSFMDKDDNLTVKTYDIKPGGSYFLTGEDAAVYTVSNTALKNGSDLYVYNSTANEFYSYSNVRVNLSGSFESVFAETSDADLNLEICPSFERQHSFVIN